MDFMKKILFLQPKEYFGDLGVHFDSFAFSADYGLIFSLDLEDRLRSYTIVISMLEHDLHARRIVKIARSLGVATFYFLDGIFEFYNSILNPLYDLKGVEQLREDIYSSIFTPTIEHYNILKEENKNPYFYIPQRVAIPNIERNIRYDYLITTASTAYFSKKEFEILVKLIFNTYTAVVSQSKSVKFRIFDRELEIEIKKFVKNYINDSCQTIAESVGDSGVVITTQSSIIIGCLSNEIPVVILSSRPHVRGNMMTGLSISLEDDRASIINTLQDSDNEILKRAFSFYRDSKKNTGFFIDELFIARTQGLVNMPVRGAANKIRVFSLSYPMRYLYKRFNLSFMKRFYIKFFSVVHNRSS